MKNHVRIALLVLALVAIAFGCEDFETLMEVGTDKAVAKIDSLLGGLDVKQKQIELSERALQKGIDGLRKACIKSRVKQNQIAEKITPITEKIASIDQSLVKLRVYLASCQSVVIAGKVNTPEQLQKMAERAIKSRRTYQSQREGLLKSKNSLQQVISTLEQKQQDYQLRVIRHEARIAEINSKSIALKAMKDASAAMGISEEMLVTNIEKLEDKVSELFAEVESDFLVEEEHWDISFEEQKFDSIESVISAPQNPAETIAEIDQILKGAK
jgi:chromosome segregation ATPase